MDLGLTESEGRVFGSLERALPIPARFRFEGCRLFTDL